MDEDFRDAISYRIPISPLQNVIHQKPLHDLNVVQCPVCFRRLRTKRTTKKGDKYCPNCGQAIDWSTVLI